MADTLTAAEIRESHLIDDFEILRTQTLRSNRRANELLSLGMTALEDGNPKVALEMMQRALNLNMSTVERLKVAKPSGT